MSNKKRYRIRKAQKGEQAGVKNQMQQFMAKAQAGMQQPSPEEMAMMQQQAAEPREINSPQDLQRNSLSQEEAIIIKIQELLKSDSTPTDVVMYLMQNNVDKQSILGAFDALGVSPDKTEQFIAQVESMLEAKGEDQNMAMSQESQMQEQAPQMSKGGYKKKILEEVKEGREAQTETPGSILPQPSTLNKFVNSVKDQGNEFYAKQMTEMTYGGDSESYMKDGGEKRREKKRKKLIKKGWTPVDGGWIDDKGRLRSKSINDKEVDIDSDTYGDDPNYKKISGNLKNISSDFVNSMIGDVFTHGSRDDIFNRKESGIDPQMDIYYKNRLGNRDQWAITGVDRDFLPTVMGSGSDYGRGYGSSRRSFTRTIPGVTSSIISKVVNNANDDTDDPLNDREEEINSKESVFDMVQTQPSAAEAELNRQIGMDEDGLFFDKNPYSAWQDMPFNSEGTPTIADTYGGVNAPRPEEVIETTEEEVLEEEVPVEEVPVEEQETTTKVPADNSGVTDDMNFSDAFRTAREAQGGKGGKFMWKGKEYGTATYSEMPEEWQKKNPRKTSSSLYDSSGYKAYKDKYSEPGEYGFNELDRRYNYFNAPTGEIKEYVNYNSYANMIDNFKEWASEADEANMTEKSYPFLYMIEKYDNATEEEKAELEKKFKKAKELPGKQADKLAKTKEKHAKNAKTKEAALEYFKRADPSYVRDPKKYKIVDIGNGRWDLDYVGGGNAKQYDPSNYNRSAFPNLAFGGSVSPDLYEFVYGGDEMDEDPDAYKNLEDPYFAPGGAFNKPKLTKEQKKLAKNAEMDPVLGPMSPTQAVEDHRNNPDLISKGIFGQFKDHLKTRLPIKKTFQALKEIAFKPDFTYATKKGDNKGAYGYFGADGYSNVLTPEYDPKRVGPSGPYEGAALNMEVKEKGILGRDELKINTSPFDNRGRYLGLIDPTTGRPYAGNLNLNSDGENSLGGLNKFVTAGEIELDYFEQQNAPNMNAVANKKKEDFNIEDCTEEDFADPKSKCYEMGNKEEDYKLNKAYSLPGKLGSAAGDAMYSGIMNIDTAADNQRKNLKEFEGTPSDGMVATVETGTGGYDKRTGEKLDQTSRSMFADPIYIQNTKSETVNFTQRGGQYAVGGVYDLTPQQIDAIYAAGGSIEIIQ